jgi:SAM-dependent methyltransferase
MMKPELVSTACAICDVKNNASILYQANFDVAAFNPDVFSARRLPDMLHYQIVRCNLCGLVRSDPVADTNVLKMLYQQSSFTYSKDTPNLTKTYGHYLRKAEKYQLSKQHLLEIGCGNGFFLVEALVQGFSEVSGVEPSKDAISHANPEIQPKILCDIMRPGLFPPNTFSAICMFQTFDHVAEPNILLGECFKILQPGGMLLCLNHNVDALSSRILKEKSPIIDIEHTYLYSPTTIKRLFEKHGFSALEVKPAWNIIRLYSLFRLIPLPRGVKQKILALIESARLNKICFRVPLGNLYIIAQKTPESRESRTNGNR